MSVKVKLTSSDKQTFEVDEEVATQSHTINNVIEEFGTEEMVPLANVSGKILSKAADYLQIKGLNDLACQAVANLIKGKSAHEIRKMLKNEYTPEQEEDMCREFKWVCD